MIWAQLLAYVTGTVDQELLLRNESGSGEPQNLFSLVRKGEAGRPNPPRSSTFQRTCDRVT